jgi:hypothetical protein
MWSMFSHLLEQSMPRVTGRKNRRAALLVAPMLQVLEDRVMPAAYFFTGVGMDGGNWTNPRNWALVSTGLPNGLAPGDGDTAAISASSTVFVPSGSNVTVSGVTNSGSLAVNGTLNGGDGSSGSATQGAGVFTSTGVLTIPSGGTLNIIKDGFLLTGATVGGALSAEAGAHVTLEGLGTVTGVLDSGAAANVTIAPPYFSAGAWTLMSGSRLSGGGMFTVTGVLDIDTGLNPDADITLGTSTAGGTIGGTGSIDEWHGFTWNNGIFGTAGGMLIEPSADFQMTGSGDLATTINNYSMNTELNGTGVLGLDDGGVFNNISGTVDVSLSSIYETGSTGIFKNNGTLDVKLGAAGPTFITSNFENTGTLQVSDGAALYLDNTGDPPGTFDLTGELQLDGDLYVVGAWGSSTGLVENAGAGTLYVGDSSGVTSTPSGTLTLSQGAVFSGNVEVTVFGSLYSGGQVSNNGKLTLDVGATTGLDSYQQTSDGWLVEQDSGSSSGPDGGSGEVTTLTIGGSAQLAGVIEIDPVNGFTISVGDGFLVLTAGSISGNFDTGSLPAGMTPTYTSTSVTLTQTS